MAESLSSRFATLVSTDPSQKFHISDTNGNPILSTNPESPTLASLSQVAVTSNSALEHLGLGRIKRVHARYANGEVIQTARLDTKTGAVSTVAGKEIRQSVDFEKIVNVVHRALEGNEERERMQQESDDDDESSENQSKYGGERARTSSEA